MKNKHYSIPLLLLLLGIFSLFYGCKSNCDPDNPEKGETYDLDKNKTAYLFPYKNLEPIMLSKNSSVIVAFSGGNRRDDYYENATEEDCPILHTMQTVEHNFVSSAGNTIILKYYRLPPSKGGSAEFKIFFNEVQFGPVNPDYESKDTIYIKGVPYTGILKMTHNFDSIYYKGNVGVLRIKYGSTTYDKIP